MIYNFNYLPITYSYFWTDDKKQFFFDEFISSESLLFFLTILGSILLLFFVLNLNQYVIDNIISFIYLFIELHNCYRKEKKNNVKQEQQIQFLRLTAAVKKIRF